MRPDDHWVELTIWEERADDEQLLKQGLSAGNGWDVESRRRDEGCE